MKQSGSTEPVASKVEIIVKSVNTGGTTVRILNSSGTELVACIVPDNTTQLCGTMDAITTYQVTAQTNKCGPLGPATFNDGLAGRVTRSVFCN
jgi:hypothetical protein